MSGAAGRIRRKVLCCSRPIALGLLHADRGATLRELRKHLPCLQFRVDICVDEHVRPKGTSPSLRRSSHVELVINDEAARLSMTAFEYLLFDRDGIGLILIGMPGIQMNAFRLPPVLQPCRLRPYVSAVAG
jgi:hypothetical protein